MTKVTQADIQRAKVIAIKIMIDELTHEDLQEILAAHRIAAIEECAKVARESKKKWMKHPNNRIIIENIEAAILALKGGDDD